MTCLANGAKISGILLENTKLPEGELAVVCGFGVNIAHHPQAALYPTTDLKTLGVEISPAALHLELAQNLAELLQVWSSGQNFAAIRTEWLAHAANLGTEIAVNLPTERLTGKFIDMDSSGCLVLGLADGSQKLISAGDVFLSRQSGIDKVTANPRDELVFLPLGGVGEIGMNLALYGYGPANKREWIIVDCGVSFAGEELPGVDLILPDIRFIEANRPSIKAMIITHAHEDHYGAVMDLWPRIKCPLWVSPFTAGLLEAKHNSDGEGDKLPVTIYRAGESFTCGPFQIEAVPVHPFHTGTVLAGNHHAAWHHHPHWRLENRPDARHRPRHRRSKVPRTW